MCLRPRLVLGRADAPGPAGMLRVLLLDGWVGLSAGSRGGAEARDHGAPCWPRIGIDPAGMPSALGTAPRAENGSLEQHRHFDPSLAKTDKFLEGWQEVDTSGPAQLHQEGEKSAR